MALKPSWLHPKDTGIDGCLVGAYLFSGAGYGLLFSSFSFGGPPRGLLFSFMVDGVFFWNAFFFLEVIFSRDFRAREISRLFKIVASLPGLVIETCRNHVFYGRVPDFFVFRPAAACLQGRFAARGAARPVL